MLKLLTACLLFAAAPAFAQSVANDQPIEITADKLDVHQDRHLAIFTGNVLATQGQTNLKSTKMTVYYEQAAPKSQAAPSSSAQGISKIEAEGDVVFTTPSETAQGDFAVYRAATDTIDLTGSTVTLTREQNILKGRALNYNLSTGRSVLTGGSPSAETGKPARVKGLFVSKGAKK